LRGSCTDPDAVALILMGELPIQSLVSDAPTRAEMREAVTKCKVTSDDANDLLIAIPL